MKKFNKNILLFAAAAVFVLIGLCSKPLLGGLCDSVKNLCQQVVSGEPDAFADFVVEVDAASQKLSTKPLLLDLNSLKDNLLGTRIVVKRETTVVKADSGSLLGYLITEPISEEAIQQNASDIEQIKELAHAAGADFLYCAVTPKTFYETLPANMTEFNTKRYEDTLEALSFHNIPVLDTRAFFQEMGMEKDELFFRTDHHWTPLAGFHVAGAICRELQMLYGFSFDPALANLENYHIETYSDWFLGSYGKQTGSFFTASRVDDFDLITPRFQTSFTEEIPIKNVNRTGPFEDTMIHTGNLEKDYYNINTYTAYSGGDYRLQIITNHNQPAGAKILIVRNSYGCVVTPFLALHAQQLHVIDNRDGSYPSGEKVNLEEYIRSVEPDYVIVLE